MSFSGEHSYILYKFSFCVSSPSCARYRRPPIPGPHSAMKALWKTPTPTVNPALRAPLRIENECRPPIGLKPIRDAVNSLWSYNSKRKGLTMIERRRAKNGSKLEECVRGRRWCQSQGYVGIIQNSVHFTISPSWCEREIESLYVRWHYWKCTSGNNAHVLLDSQLYRYF